MSGYNRSDMSQDNAGAVANGQSLLSMLAPNVNTNTVHAGSPPKTPDPGDVQGQARYGAAVQEHSGKVMGALEQNLRTAAAIEGAMRERAGEALAAEKLSGGSAFAASMDNPTGTELAMTAISISAGGKGALFQGAGSLVTSGAQGLGEVLNVMNDRNLTSEDAREMVASILVTSSEPQPETFGTIMDANAAESVPVGIDWAPAIAAYGTRAAVVAVEFDLSNPPPEMPEVSELMSAIGQQYAQLQEYQASGLLEADPELEARIELIGEFLGDPDFSGLQANQAIDTNAIYQLLIKNSGGSSTDQDLEAEAARASTRFDMTSTAI